MAKLFANDTIGPSSEYQEQLRKEHNGSKWGSSGARYTGAYVLSLLTDRPYIQTVLDFGAGKGSLGRYIREAFGEQRSIEWTDYDPGVPEISHLPSGQFDLVISTDVLEHVEPDRLEETIKQLEAKTGKVLLNDIACYPTRKYFMEGPYIGEDMHLTVESPEWWRDLFNKTISLQEFEYYWHDRRNRAGPKIRCRLVHERV